MSGDSPLTRVILRRLAHALLVIAGVVILSFVIARILPGDPAVSFAGREASAAELQAVRDRYSLDEPLLVQLGVYLRGLFTLDLGTSLLSHQPVAQDIATYLPSSIELVVLALIIATGVGIPLGAAAALAPGRWRDVAIRVTTAILFSIPGFWLALLLQLTLASQIRLFPIAGQLSTQVERANPLATVTGFKFFDSVITGNVPVAADILWHMLLPAIVLASGAIALIAQVTRAALISELGSDYVKFASALGYSRGASLWRFAFRTASPPILSLIGLMFANTIVSGFLVENVFAWPGIGTYVTKAIQGLDFPAVTGVTLVAGIIFVVANTVVDLVQLAADPRANVA